MTLTLLLIILNRTTPVKTFSWGSDTVITVKFNPVELDILASTATDRSVALYDLRGGTPIRKLIMAVSSYMFNARS